MKVKVGNRYYSMDRQEYEGLLKIAGEQVETGIFAVEKRGYAELRCDRGSITQTKKLRNMFKKQGFKVYANGI